VGLAAVPSQKKSAQIRHGRAHKRGQFRVRAGGLREGLRPRPHKVAHGLIYGPIFGGSWNNA